MPPTLTHAERQWLAARASVPHTFECECSWFPDRLPGVNFNGVCCFHDWAYAYLDTLDPASEEWCLGKRAADKAFWIGAYSAMILSGYWKWASSFIAWSMYQAVHRFGRLGKRVFAGTR